jgi:putative ABC transport system permease protein
MMSGLVRQALRRNPWAFAGPFTTQCMAAALVSGSLGVNTSLHGARLAPDARRR